MTSTVEATSTAPIPEIFRALFPCASVTGAPKIRAMQIISEHEASPRGVYTGAIGSIGPGRRARFNVAIRTVQIDHRSRLAVYGTGGGIVWDSVAAEEWRECQTKALVLRPPAPRFELLESLLWTPADGYRGLDSHLERLSASADYFDYPVDLEVVRERLDRLAASLPDGPHKVRLLLDDSGTIRTGAEATRNPRRRWRIALADRPVSSSDPFLYHKTTYREVYDRCREVFPEHDDVLLWNERGEITETTVANVVLCRNGERLTPPVACGLLAGTLRGELLARAEITEAPIRLEDLSAGDELYLINSVRGWIPSDLDPATLEPHR